MWAMSKRTKFITRMLSNPWTRALMVLPVGVFFFFVLVWIFKITSPAGRNEIRLPSDLDEAKKLYQVLAKYNEDHSLYVLEVFVLTYLFKQAFNIPGSSLLNILAGALFGEVYGTILCSLCTASGATLNYLISSYFFKGLVLLRFRPQVQKMAEMVFRHRRHGLFFYLVSVRVLPMMPNFLMNAIFPIIGVPIWQFFFSVLIGLLPFQYACARGGLVISSMASIQDVLDQSSIINLIMVSALFLIPAFLLKRFAPPLPPLEPRTMNPH